MVLKLIGVNPSAPFAPILSNMPVKLSFHLRAMALSMNGIEIRKSDNKSTLIVSFFQKIKAYYFMKVVL